MQKNLQYIISYLGIIPYFLVLFNKYVLLQIDQEISLNFIIYYTLLVHVFIGSTNWNLKECIPNYLIVYGFIPSVFAIIIICLNLYNYQISIIFILLILILTLQLFFDYFLIFANSKNKNPFYFLRLPLTLLIILSLVILSFFK